MTTTAHRSSGDKRNWTVRRAAQSPSFLKRTLRSSAHGRLVAGGAGDKGEIAVDHSAPVAGGLLENGEHRTSPEGAAQEANAEPWGVGPAGLTQRG